MAVTKAEALRAWRAAQREYNDAVESVLVRERHESHDLDVIEALAREAQRALADYREARGERERR